MTQKFKVGDKVRILDVSEMELVGNLKNGDICEVVTVRKRGSLGLCRLSDRNSFLIYAEELPFIELISDKLTQKQRLSDAEKRIAELEAKVEALEKAQKPKRIHIEEYIGKQAQKTPSANEQRKAIIAEAKAFVDGAKNFTGRATHRKGYRYPKTESIVCDATFHVNKGKRTVTVILRNQVGDKRVTSKAIAKCAPDDVFNADIGKAIALGRALGLDVSKFEQAVKPTEVVVGHVVSGGQDGYYRPSRKFTLTSEREGESFYYAEASEYKGNTSYDWIKRSQIGAILDDTEAKY